ncbi:Heat shock transcription factor [Stygiomarasmius scandens]|uniref:Heat shock transcription factor n=1 Tax=Marasmiellus scandens TaxID=2682957 RepID=A0ABR1K3B4_9AGAR
MANKRQVAALTSSSYGSSNINTRVPMFLQKLYKIVSDPSTNDVICWSDSGDSFFVHDHERLAKEHLGNWFKHNKFASFVRQLNMYGFHKIPHLQQGVLRSDSDAEHSQFAHPDFHRGQEDRLIFIERKKQAGSSREQGVVDFPANSQANSASQNGLPSNQPLDMHSIIAGIAAIRRHQTNISAELTELKRSNQLLWQESMEARTRHQKQQDTINRIVKFLAGIFGQATNGNRDKNQGSSPSHSVVPGTRLMIEDSKRDNVPKVGIVEIQDEDNISPVEVLSRETSPFVTIDTPADSTATRGFSPASPMNSDMSSFPATTPRIDLGTPQLEYPTSPVDATLTGNNSIISTQPRYATSGISNDNNVPPFSPSHSPITDERLQEALSRLSPGDLQQFIASLSQMPGMEDNAGDGNNQLSQLGPNQLTPFKGNPFELGNYPSSNDLNAGGTANDDSLISFDSPLQIEQNWAASTDIEKDVSNVNAGIDSLMQTLGLDPSAFLNAENFGDGTDHNVDATALLDPSLTTGNGPVHPSTMPANSDEIFHSFLNTFSTDSSHSPNLVADSPATTFLDEPPPVNKVSPAVGIPNTQLLDTSDKSRKRKSDAATDVATKLQLPTSKAKRRKDK